MEHDYCMSELYAVALNNPDDTEHVLEDTWRRLFGEPDSEAYIRIHSVAQEASSMRKDLLLIDADQPTVVSTVK